MEVGDTLIVYTDGRFRNNCRVSKITRYDSDSIEDIEVTVMSYSLKRKVMNTHIVKLNGFDLKHFLDDGTLKLHKGFKPIKEFSTYSFKNGI